MTGKLSKSRSIRPDFAPQSRLLRYGLAMLAVVYAALAIHYIPVIGESGRGALLLFFFSIILVTLWLGLYPGILALTLSLIGINTFLLAPVWRTEPYDALFLNSGFCFLSTLIIATTHFYHRQTRILQQSQEDMNLAQTVAQIGSWRFKVQGNKLYWTDEKYRIFEIAKGTLVTIETFFSAIHPEDREYVDRMWQASLRGEPYDIEHRIIVAGGKVKWIREKAILEFDNKKLLGGFGTTQDISERKKLEQEQQNLIERYELVLDGAQDAIWDWDIPNKRVNFSSRWKAMRGFTDDEVGTSEEEWSESIHPDDRVRVMAAVQAHFDGNSPFFCEEYRIRCKNGSWKWILDRGIAKKDSSGRVIRMAGSENDITQRKNTETELCDRENQLNLIMNLTPALISYLDTDFRYMRANKTYEDWFGIDVKDIIGHEVREIVGEDTWKFAEPHLERARTGEIASYENQLSFPNKLIRWVKATFVPDMDENGTVKGIVVHVADIDERKQAEQQIVFLNQTLQQRIEEMDAIYNTAPIGLAICLDTEAKFIRGNPTIERMLGLPPESELSLSNLSPPPVRVLIDGYEPPAEELPMQRAARGERVSNQILDIHRVDGQIVTLICNAASLFNEHGAPRGAVGAFLDITALKNAELALQNSEERLRLAQTAGNLGIFDQDLVSGEMQWDDRLRELWGIQPDEPLVTDTCMARVHPDDRAQVYAAVKRSFNPQNNGDYHAEYRIIRPTDGKLFWLAAFGTTTFDSGRPVRLVGFVQDISERKHTEEMQRITEIRLSLAMGALNAGFWEWEREGNKAYFSPVWKKQLGYEDHELPNRQEEWEKRLHPDDRKYVFKTVEHYLNNFMPSYTLEFRLRHKDCSYRWIQSRAGLTYNQNNQLIRMAGIHLDITDLKNAEILNQQRNKMEDAFRLNVASQTVAAIAHELNQPLTTISYFADAAVDMMKSGNKNPQKLSHVLESCSAQAQRAGQVIRQLLSVLQKGDTQSEPVDINKMVTYAYEYIRINNPLYSFHFELNLAAGLPQILANTLQIQKILINLILNSLEAMHECGNNSGTIAITTCFYAKDPSMALITVRDSGGGVADVDTLSKMFQPFYTTKPTGLGMGLTISRTLIEAYGGKMWAEQNADVGISVHFTLPFVS